MGDFQQQREAGAGRPDNELSSTLLMLPEWLTSHIPEDNNDEPETTIFSSRERQELADLTMSCPELAPTGSFTSL